MTQQDLALNRVWTLGLTALGLTALGLTALSYGHRIAVGA